MGFKPLPTSSITFIALLLILIGGCTTSPKVTPPPPTDAEKRINSWQSLIESMGSSSTDQKLLAVNAFFNQLEFVDDIDHWGREDYWATPLETLRTNGGDCEDFTIAKYFTLREMDVPETSMRLAYVRSLTLNQPHMVLIYRKDPAADSLVLDNLVNAIVPAAQRNDLVPIYSFNTLGLWIAKQHSDEVYAGNINQIRPWSEFLQRSGMKTAIKTKLRQ